MKTLIPDWHKAPAKHIWRVTTGRTFFVEVVAWSRSDDRWTWNVYANIYDSHPLFGNTTAIMESAPFHGGCTLDEIITEEPARGIRYDWQRKVTYYRFGSDYAHSWDEGFLSWPPTEGIPTAVIRDAEALVAWLSEGGAA